MITSKTGRVGRKGAPGVTPVAGSTSGARAVSAAAPVVAPVVAPTAADHDLAALAKALGHPARVAILRFLTSKGSCMCGRIVSRLPLAQATVSQHLKMLKESGLVEGEIDGPRVCYCARPEALARLKALLAEL
ncbi:MAG: winged helix-turn-helix transcriptional regulator [Candidatus Eisenbacteria bacterium]|nr:winged helix-turn-helix transcriptional regulator [Candidatus Eisenbacteria bacterium]